MVISPWSNTLPRLTAAIAPAGTPMAIANSIAHSDNSIVAGNRVRNSVSTFSWVDSDTPKSPCSSRQQ